MSDSNESTPKKEWCLYCFQYLKGKQLRRRLLPQTGEAPRCEICGEVMTSCGCRPRGSLYEPDNGCWICDGCFERFKPIYAWEEPGP